MYSQDGGRFSVHIFHQSRFTMADSLPTGFCWYWACHLELGSSFRSASSSSIAQNWGIFNYEEDYGMPNIILLNTYRKRVEYPDLKRDVLAEYREFEPDGVLIEKKASGAPLIYDLRAMGIPVQDFTPGKGQDKIARLNAVSDIIASGKVWVPETRWAEELIDEIAEFPSGQHDDLVDATTLALMRFRQGGFLRLPSDEPEDVKYFKGHRNERYYTV